jgi:hypothetical protein
MICCFDCEDEKALRAIAFSSALGRALYFSMSRHGAGHHGS